MIFISAPIICVDIYLTSGLRLAFGGVGFFFNLLFCHLQGYYNEGDPNTGWEMLGSHRIHTELPCGGKLDVIGEHLIT